MKIEPLGSSATAVGLLNSLKLAPELGLKPATMVPYVALSESIISWRNVGHYFVEEIPTRWKAKYSMVTLVDNKHVSISIELNIARIVQTIQC